MSDIPKYRVDISDREGNGAWRSANNLAVAVCEAVDGSFTITSRAFIVGVLSWAIIEEALDVHESKIAATLIETMQPPGNMREFAAAALEVSKE